MAEETTPPSPPKTPESAQVGDQELNSDFNPGEPATEVQGYNPGYVEPEDLEGVQSVPVIVDAKINEADKFGYVNVSPEYKRFTGPEASSNPDVPTGSKSKTIPSL